jgi:hypothetical protein
VAPLSLSDEQKRGLAQRGYGWVQTIKRLNKAGKGLEGDDAAFKHRAAINDVHMLSLALQHLDSCLKFLTESGETLAGAADFRAAWHAVSDLRAALEHEEEYIAGRGKRPRLSDQSWVANGYFEDHLLIWGSEGIDWVGFMGREYRVRPAIAAALNLEAPLLDLYEPPGRLTKAPADVIPQPRDQ